MAEGSDLRIGVLASTHGIHGEVNILPVTDNPERFSTLKECYLVCRGKKLTLHAEGVKFVRKFAVIKFREFGDISEAERYRGADVYVTRENALTPPPGEYFIADLIGQKVVTDEGEPLGILEDIFATGASNVYSVITPEGREILIPAVKPFVVGHDMEQGVTTVHLIPGMRE